MFKRRETLNVSAVFINWHFTAFVVNVVIMNAYLTYLSRSFIDNAYSKMESLRLIAHPSKNVNTLELCWCSPFSIVKIYFHHRLHFFFSLTLFWTQVCLWKKSEQSNDFPFSLLLLSHCWFCHPMCQPRHSVFWVWEKFTIPQFANIYTLWEILYWLFASNTSCCKQS